MDSDQAAAVGGLAIFRVKNYILKIKGFDMVMRICIDPQEYHLDGCRKVPPLLKSQVLSGPLSELYTPVTKK